MTSAHQDETRTLPSAAPALSRRQLLKAASLAAAAAGSVAFVGDVTAAPASSAHPAEALMQDVTLKLNGRTGAEQEMFEKFIAKFAESHPGVTIKGEYFAGANQEYFQKVAVLFAGGNPGDLVWLSSIEGYYDYAARDQLLPVDDLIARDKVDPKQWYPAAVKMMKVEGPSYALPLWSHPSIVGLYYNEDLLTASGVEVPNESWTTDQLASAAQQVTKVSGRTFQQMGYMPATEVFNGLMEVVPSFGGKVISDDGKKITLDMPETKTAIQWLADLFVKNKVAPPPGTQDVNQLMASSKGAMLAGGYWNRWTAEATWKF